MKLTVSRSALLEVLGDLIPLAPKRATLPIIGKVLLVADKGKLEATATDLQTVLTRTIKAEVSKHGGICVDPKALSKFLKAVDTDKVMLAVGKGNKLDVYSGLTVASLECDKADDYPKMSVPAIKGGQVVITNLAASLGEVSYAQATEEVRPILRGVSFSPMKGGIEMAAADGYRLAVTKAKARGKLPSQVIVCLEAVAMLRRLKMVKTNLTVLEHRDNPENVTYTLQFQTGGISLLTKPVVGTFPDYKRLIPAKGKAVRVITKQMLAALSQVSAMSLDTVRLQTKGKTLKVWGQSNDGLVLSTTIPATGKIKSAFNLSYFKEMIALAGEQFTFKQESPSTPGVIKTKLTSHVIMPMHVNW